MNSRKALEKIKDIVGEEKYIQIVNELAGVTVYFPASGEWESKGDRNNLIKADFYSGKYEISDLAKKYNLSISRIYKIIQNNL